MAIKITFPALESTKTAPSLYQWDYGQILEIESADLAPIVEVHFACSGMTEAIVRPCSVNNGIATVPIPDICLEHAGTIMAWVFEINGTEGMTRKTITIPVIGRVKPAPGGEIPTEFHDRYTELITEIEEAISELTKGNVTAAQAKNANYATEAGHATTATTADALTKPDNISVGSATNATNATWASRAGRLNITTETSTAISSTGLYLVLWKNTAGYFMTDLIFIDDLMGHDIGTTGGYGGASSSEGPWYSAYDREIVVTSGGSIFDVYKIADYTPSVG